MEHLERFGLEREPFRNEPQPDFWFESRGAADAKARLLRCLRQGKELSVLCGEVGAGTTTLARRVLDELDPDRFEVGLLVVGRGVEAAWLRAAIARQLGVAEPAEARGAAMRQLYEHLVRLRQDGRRAVIAIDEAQALGGEPLAELVAMLNFEHEDERLLSALLVGSLELERMLGREPALLGRCELRVRLEPLAGEEARAYIAHRLVVAGGDPALFAPELADVIAERAGGLPRRMNALADNALFEAHLARREWPEAADIERAARDLPWAASSADTLAGVTPAALGLEPPKDDAAPPIAAGLDGRARAAASAALEALDGPDLGADL
ncbi:MAG TPA: AAA family ATPase, partial [Myxococcota bacterium]|nr:AAA family ATPase [Myxococcota bacterium]